MNKLTVPVELVASVLLNDQWHDVADRSFQVGKLIFIEPSAGGGTAERTPADSGTSMYGAQFKGLTGQITVCPIEALQAVRLLRQA